MGYERDGREGGRFEGDGRRDERGSHRTDDGDYGFRGVGRDGERAGDYYQLQSYRGGEHGAYPRGTGDRNDGRGARDDDRRGPPDRAYGQTNQYSQGLASPGAYAGSGGGYGSGARVDDRGHPFDTHYHNWRDKQMADLDRDYHEFRQEHQQRFEREFHGWRQKRQGQRELLQAVRENMEVVGSDGARIGTVDKLRGDRVVLNRRDAEAGGHHHSFPSSWIEAVEDKVVVNRSATEAMRHWQDEERDRPLNDRGGGEAGPHFLDRAFGGTYEDR